MNLKRLGLLALVSVGFLFGGQGYVDVTGIRKAPLEADSQNLPKLQENETPPMPGKTKPLPTSFVTAPPMIPHSVKGMVPIKVGKNQCLTCHMPNVAKQLKITPMPPDHFVDNFEGNKKEPKVAGSRYFCTTCHAPQAKVDPVIENRFESLRGNNSK
jgi:cytochrome c-type protein NapB